MRLFFALRIPLLFAIRLYQHTLSPDHSFWAKHVYPVGFCKFAPTCSAYGYESIKRFGIIMGGAKTLWRILRCNPWSRGGIDLP